MKIIGLTGSIGMGKSATAALLQNLGVPVHDSDAAVHIALSPEGGAFRDVALEFPEAWDKATHTINRKILGAIVFADAEKRRKLEALVHPHVWDSQREFIKRFKSAGAKLVVLDIPLLYETGAESKCDEVMVVTAPSFIQRQRVLSRPGMSEEKFQSILKNQVPDAEKRRRADYIIHTGLGRAYTLWSLKKYLKGKK